ncbi:MAG: hypothetical protein J6035_08175 [Bacteroidaceae bacterium]|nr:hypothetical protein [Bacteroidaceae bacterium]
MKKNVLYLMSLLFVAMISLASCGCKSDCKNADEGNSEVAEAITELEGIYNWMIQVEEDVKAGKLDDDKKLETFFELWQKVEDWNEKYENIKEDDCTPEQWARINELNEQIKQQVAD